MRRRRGEGSVLVLEREDFRRGARGCACRGTGAHLYLPEMRSNRPLDSVWLGIVVDTTGAGNVTAHGPRGSDRLSGRGRGQAKGERGALGLPSSSLTFLVRASALNGLGRIGRPGSRPFRKQGLDRESAEKVVDHSTRWLLWPRGQ
jgi:hypothetical protein